MRTGAEMEDLVKNRVPRSRVEVAATSDSEAPASRRIWGEFVVLTLGIGAIASEPLVAHAAVPSFVQVRAREITTGIHDSLAFNSSNSAGNLIVVGVLLVQRRHCRPSPTAEATPTPAAAPRASRAYRHELERAGLLREKCQAAAPTRSPRHSERRSVAMGSTSSTSTNTPASTRRTPST